jgi:hypothetical protein
VKSVAIGNDIDARRNNQPRHLWGNSHQADEGAAQGVNPQNGRIGAAVRDDDRAGAAKASRVLSATGSLSVAVERVISMFCRMPRMPTVLLPSVLGVIRMLVKPSGALAWFVYTCV